MKASVKMASIIEDLDIKTFSVIKDDSPLVELRLKDKDFTFHHKFLLAHDGEGGKDKFYLHSFPTPIFSHNVSPEDRISRIDEFEKFTNIYLNEVQKLMANI